MFEILASITPFLETFTLAQVPLDDLVEKGVDKISAVSVILGVVGITYGGYKMLRGETEYALHAVAGGILVAGAYPLMKSLFEVAN